MISAVRRRPLLFGVGGVVVLFLLLAAWLGATALLARGHLVDLRSEVSRLQNDVSNGRTDRLNPGLASIREDAEAARGLTSDPVWWVASRVPVLGRTFETSSGLARSADQLADTALPELVSAADQLDPAEVRRRDGTLALSRLTAASPHLDRAATALVTARSTVASLPDTGVVGPVADARIELDQELTSLAGSLDAAGRAARIGPAMLGDQGPRRYLVMFQNPAEARGTGGLAGSFAVIRADKGDLTRERTGSDADLEDAPAPVVDLGPEFNARWRAADVDRGWRSANSTPHYPWAAEIWQKLWQEQTGQPIDGVIAVDPIGLSYILKVTGPIRLSDGEVLTGDNVAEWTLSTEYFKYPGEQNDRRKELLTELAEKAFDRISEGDGRSAALLTALGKAAGEHRVLLWAERPGEQSVIAETPIAGRVLDQPGPFVMPVLNNGGGNKLDYYVERTLTREVLRCDADRRLVRTTLALKNTAPPTGLPPYIGGRVDGQTSPPGTSRTFVALHLTQDARLTGAAVDGRPAQAVVGTERGRPVSDFDVDIRAGQTRTIAVEYTEPRSDAPVVVPVQPLAKPMTVRISDACP